MARAPAGSNCSNRRRSAGAARRCSRWRSARCSSLAGEEVRAGGGKQRVAKLRAEPRAHRLGRAAMTEEGFALAAPETLAGEGLVHQAEQRYAVTGQPDQRAPKRQAEDEGAGAVDRIDDPAILGVAAQSRRTPRRGCRATDRTLRRASRMAVSASRSAAVTGSNRSPPLWSMAPPVRKCGNMTAPALSARACAVARRAGIQAVFLGVATGKALRCFTLRVKAFRAVREARRPKALPPIS